MYYLSIIFPLFFFTLPIFEKLDQSGNLVCPDYFCSWFLEFLPKTLLVTKFPSDSNFLIFSHFLMWYLLQNPLTALSYYVTQPLIHLASNYLKPLSHILDSLVYGAISNRIPMQDVHQERSLLRTAHALCSTSVYLLC